MSTKASKQVTSKYDKAEELEKKLTPLLATADLKGHDSDAYKDETRKFIFDRLLSLLGLYETSESLDKLLNTKGEWLKLMGHSSGCPLCGKDIHFEFNGDQLRAIEPCRFEGGVKPQEILLNIPSGKMVVANDLRDIFRVVGDFNVNTTAGCYDTTSLYAEAGMFHAFVGNTCPSMFSKGTAKGKKYSHFSLGVHKGKEANKVASICTDLWWVSIADYTAFINAGGKVKEYGAEVVDCVPGTYRFKHFFQSHGEEHKVFTEIDRVGDATDIKDPQAEFKQLNYTLGQVLHVFNQSWDNYLTAVCEHPHLDKPKEPFTPEQIKARRAQRMLDHIFFTLGNGQDWHENGWSSSSPMPKGEIPELPIPTLDGKYNWYPSSDYSFIASLGQIACENWGKGKIKLNQSFWRGLIMCLQCIVKHGVEGRDEGQGVKKDDFDTKNLCEAVLVSLINQYPEFVTEEDRQFIKKFKIENSLETYKATQELTSAILKACPQPNNQKNEVIYAQIREAANQNGIQNRKITIAAILKFTRANFTDFEDVQYAQWDLQIIKDNKGINVIFNEDGITHNLTLEEAKVQIAKACKRAIAHFTPIHKGKLPEIIETDRIKQQAKKAKYGLK